MPTLSKEEGIQGFKDLYRNPAVNWYTKEMIRKLHDQIVKGGPFKLLGVDGKEVTYEIPTLDAQTEELLRQVNEISTNKRFLDYVSTHKLFNDVHTPFLTIYPAAERIQLANGKKTGTLLHLKEVMEETKEELMARIGQQQTTWEQSPACTEIVNMLETTCLPALKKTQKITQIVAIGLGCFSFPHRVDGTIEISPRPVDQHLLLKTLEETLQKFQGPMEPIDCYVQDPWYADQDEKILQGDRFKFKVIEDPDAWLRLDDSAAVISISPNVPTWEIVAEIARPAMMIMDTIDTGNTDQHEVKENGRTPRVRKFIDQGYESQKFPSYADSWSGLSLYWRKN